VLSLTCDDGAIVYLNGQRLVTFNAPATSKFVSVLHESEVYFSVPDAVLKKGPNVLAVEVYQAGAETSDLSFDMQLFKHVTAELIEILSQSELAWDRCLAPRLALGLPSPDQQIMSVLRRMASGDTSLVVRLWATAAVKRFDTAYDDGWLNASRPPSHEVQWSRGMVGMYLNHASWNVVKHEGLTRYEYQHALDSAKLASSLMPREDTYYATILNTLGVALFRLDFHEQALDAFAKSDECYITRHPTPNPENRIFSAMALQALGKLDAAKAELDLAAKLAKEADFAGDTETLALLSEAKSRIQTAEDVR
jgi:tetratricopeptide (TPR) repeat protein